MVILFALVALCLSGSAFASSPILPRCPAVETESNFDLSRYMGVWYQNQNSATFGRNSRCVSAVYSNGENGLVNVVNSYISGTTQEASTANASLRVPNSGDASKLKIRYPSMPVGVEGDYYVLRTDYDSYAVVYSCSDRRGTVTKYAWILTRERQPSEQVVAEAVAVLERNGINRSELTKTDHADC